MNRNWIVPGWMPGLAVLPLIAGLALPAHAGEEYKPMAAPSPEPEVHGGIGIKGEVTLEFESDHTYKSDDPDAELRDSYNTTEIGVEVTFGQRLSASGAFTFEPVLDPGPGEDRFFEDEGLYAEELYGKLMLREGVHVFAGKFNPAFGSAWDVTPGLYGTDFAEDYETAERIGVGSSIERAAGGLGTVTLSAAAYYLDTSALSRSVFTDRGRTSISDGGASNTESLDSFAIAFDAAEAPALGGANLHLGYRFQKQGETVDDLADEHGYVAGLNGSRSMNSVELDWVAEVAYLDNAEGTRDDLWYYTIGAALKFAGKYNISASYTGRPRDVVGGMDLDDELFAISAGVELSHGWTFDAGYKYHVEDDVDNHTVGVLLARSFEFGR